MSLSSLPNEVILMIASSLSTNQLLAPLRTNRTLHHVLIANLYLRNLKTGHSTGFFACCESGHKEGVELMLLYGADIEGTDTRTSRKDGSIPNSQLTALDLAAGNGHDQIVSLLLDHGARVSFQSKFPDRYSPLITAACVGFHKTTELFLNHSAFANHEGRPEMAHAALCGLTGHCLHAGAHAKSTMNQSAVDYDATIGLLVKHGANINAPGPFGTVSPLHNIAIGLKPIQLRILAKWGGNLAIKDAGNNNTLFHWLAKRTGSANIFDDIICLLEAGVDFNAPNIHGQTPLHLAVQSFLFPRFELVWLLLKLGAIVDCRDTGEPLLILFSEKHHCGVRLCPMISGSYSWNTALLTKLKRRLGVFSRPILMIYLWIFLYYLQEAANSAQESHMYC